jgi:hypothetical protein
LLALHSAVVHSVSLPQFVTATLTRHRHIRHDIHSTPAHSPKPPFPPFLTCRPTSTSCLASQAGTRRKCELMWGATGGLWVGGVIWWHMGTWVTGWRLAAHTGWQRRGVKLATGRCISRGPCVCWPCGQQQCVSLLLASALPVLDALRSGDAPLLLLSTSYCCADMRGAILYCHCVPPAGTSPPRRRYSMESSTRSCSPVMQSW